MNWLGKYQQWEIRSRILLVLSFLCSFHVVFSANSELKIQHWRVNQGLPDMPVIAMDQDDKGYIMLYCTEGTYRFDGEKSYPYRPASIKKSQQNIFLKNGELNFSGETFGQNLSGLVSNNGMFWITGDAGLGFFDKNTKTIQWLNKSADLPEDNCDTPVISHENKIWFSMPLFGIGFYDNEKEKFYCIQNIDEYSAFKNAHEVFSILLDRIITCLFFDKDKCLWIGTQNDGLYKISFEPQRYQFFRSEFQKEASLAHRDISFPLATKNGDIWISTWGGGINIWAKEQLEDTQPDFKSIPVLLANNKPFPDMHIFPLMEDSQENIWIGTRQGGLYMISKKDREKKNYRYKVFNATKGLLPSDEIGSFCEGPNNEIYCGTYSGLVKIRAEFSSESTFKELENPDLFQDINVCMLDYSPEGKLWIGARNNYLYVWDLNSNEVDSFLVENNGARGLLLNHVYVDGTDWFVGDFGLFYYDKMDKNIRPFMKNNLLPSNHAESLLADANGMLWVGSDSGLAKVDPYNNEVKIIDLPGGTMGINFTQGASKDKKGYMYFGSRYGLYRFHPKNMEFEHSLNPVIISQVGISGEIFTVDSIQNSTIWKQKDNEAFFQLQHQQNTISFDFLKLNYEKEDLTVFEIMLEGNDNSWTVTSDTHRTWNGLKPGDYRFTVREEGQTNFSEIKFKILLPWWLTWPAILSYVFMASILFVVFYQITSTRAKDKEKRRQKEKYDQLRFRFFLNISHEIRTPLTLIKGAIDRLVERDAEGENNEIQRIKYNTGRLIRMVNEVLDLKKIEQTEVEVNNTYFNLKEFITSTVDAFRLREDKCRINLYLPESPVWINSSRELLETVLYNLLSNAIKFSNEKGKIEVKLQAYENSCEVTVRDYGVGISREDQKKIYDRFYKKENNGTYGAGIGLSLVKEFVELLKGKIELESKPNHGSKFMIKLPLEQNNKVKDKQQENITTDRKNLLVVDDHADIRSFISEIFKNKYDCFEAENGKIALEIARKQMPELIISDVMMPEMNGFQLCKELKENIETSHIPLILLTAKTDFEAELKATECSADAFVAKPFNEKLLKARVNQIIEQRRKLIERFSAGSYTEEDAPQLSEVDNNFILKLEETIKERLDDPALNVEELASSVALSSSGLYRKIKALTNQSPVEFIRTFRLKEAAGLLRNGDKTVTEIADITGFGTQKYFSRCFKQQFNLSPLQYRKEK